MLSFCNAYRELRVHIYDHTGSVVSPPFHIEKDKDTFLRIFSSIVFGDDECIGFDTTMQIREPKLPMPSRHSRPWLPSKKRETFTDEPDRGAPDSNLTESPSNLAESPPPATSALPAASIAQTVPQSQSPIGKIQVNNDWYDILEVLFSSHGLVGRGTVCYLVRKDGEDYIIKDHWVIGEADEAIMNEVTMMMKMGGVRGVPKLVDHCKVMLSSGEIDCTGIYRYQKMASFQDDLRTHVRLVMKPRGRPLYKFRTKLELVNAIHDIVISKYPLVVHYVSTDRFFSSSTRGPCTGSFAPRFQPSQCNDRGCRWWQHWDVDRLGVCCTYYIR
jgi:hypothetical protein